MTDTTDTAATLQQLAEPLAREACRALFRAYGVTLSDIDPSTPTSDSLLLTAVIGLTGPGIRVSCILACSDGPLRGSSPAPGSHWDWIAELTNQLAGRLKSQLLNRGTEVYLTTPVVIRGEHLSPVPRAGLEPIAFAAEGGHVSLWIDVRVEPGYRPSTGETQAPAEAGEALFF